MQVDKVLVAASAESKKRMACDAVRAHFFLGSIRVSLMSLSLDLSIHNLSNFCVSLVTLLS